MPARLILGSASPRRVELLGSLGIEFDVRASGVAERPRAREDGREFARRAARDKAEVVAGAHPGRWVIGADTVVLADGVILGKPCDAADARRMLRLLSGRSHRVVTAVALIGADGGLRDELTVESVVEFHPLAAADIAAYVDSGEPFDKAGAYAIQGGAARFVRRVQGSYTNVVGLPVEEVRALLRRNGLLAAPAVAAPPRGRGAA
jgi:septum formation protein